MAKNAFARASQARTAMNTSYQGNKRKTASTDQITFEDIVRGACKTLENAESLFSEAEILARNGAIARALCLHQISLEECSKVYNMTVWAISLDMEPDKNYKNLLALLRRHDAKNKSNAYMLKRSEAEIKAMNDGDFAAATKAFNQLQKKFHEKSNKNKNASLYVDWKGGQFVAPSECITDEMLIEIKELNTRFLDRSQIAVETLKKIEKVQDKIKGLFPNFKKSMEKLRDDKPDDFMSSALKLLGDFSKNLTYILEN